ncbi:MAG: hypothetical protein ACKOZU_10450 [Planctomycetaceae bacterium]
MPAPFARFTRLRSLAPPVTWAGAVAGLVAVAAAPPPAASVYRRRMPPAVAQAGERTAEESQAERIVAGSLLALDRADPFAARIRQKARIGDRVLTGPGRYVQAGTGEERRYRFESQLECTTDRRDDVPRPESFELLEVCDGLFAWGYRRNGVEPPALSRIDVRRIRDRLEQLQPGEQDSAARYLGGLQRSLWTVREWFRFVSAEPADLDGTQAWRIEGRWDAEKLAVMLPDLAEAARRPGGVEPRELPDGVPWCVRLWIGRGDLLPRRVEWLAIPGARPAAAAAAPEPIAVLDVFDVEVGGRVDPANFFYKPAGVGLMDVTEQHAKTLRTWRP